MHTQAYNAMDLLSVWYFLYLIHHTQFDKDEEDFQSVHL